MGILNDLRTRVQSLNDGLQNGEIMRDVVVRHREDILELQRIQLLQGKASSGEDLRPYYSEDLKPAGWFKSGASAAAYAAWKQDIAYPYSVQRNPDAPNLYINGKLHGELTVEFGPAEMTVIGETMYAKNIIAKYGLEAFGLMAEKWAELFEEYNAYNELMDAIKSKLYV